MRERFFIPDTVLVQFCLSSTAIHGCIIVAVATNCTSVIPSTLASPITLVTSVTLAILVTSVILVNLVTHHLATLRTLPHSLPHPKLPLPHLPLLPPFKTFADPVACASIINFPFATDFEYYSSDAERRVGHEGALVEKRLIQPI